jgi:hypothetical protein
MTDTEDLDTHVIKNPAKGPLLLLAALVLSAMIYAVYVFFFPTGLLIVKTVPDKIPVWVNGVDVGLSPIEKEISTGSVTVKVTLPGEEAEEKTVQLFREHTTKVSFYERVPLELTTKPTQALVYVDGELKGETPIKEGVLVKPNILVKIELKKEGYLTLTKEEMPLPEQPFILDLVLQEDPNYKKPRKAPRKWAPKKILVSLDNKDVKRILRQKGQRFQSCFEEAASLRPKLQGKIVVEFTVEKDGRVLKATALSGTLGKRVSNCVLSGLKRIQFPKPGDQALTFKNSFVFQSTN